jgi:hypothetical protein
MLMKLGASRAKGRGPGASSMPKVDPQIAKFASAVNRNKLRKRRAALRVS